MIQEKDLSKEILKKQIDIILNDFSLVECLCSYKQYAKVFRDTAL